MVAFHMVAFDRSPRPLKSLGTGAGRLMVAQDQPNSSRIALAASAGEGA